MISLGCYSKVRIKEYITKHASELTSQDINSTHYYHSLISILPTLLPHTMSLYFRITVAFPTFPSTLVLNVCSKLTTVAENGVCKPALILSNVSPP